MEAIYDHDRGLAKGLGQGPPFYYVQIAPFTYGPKNGGTLLREQQAKSMSLENTGMVVVSDLVEDTTNIHPKNKHDVGGRLAGWALTETYHKVASPIRAQRIKVWK